MPINFHPSVTAKGIMLSIFHLEKDLKNFLVTHEFNQNTLEADTVDLCEPVLHSVCYAGQVYIVRT